LTPWAWRTLIGLLLAPIAAVVLWKLVWPLIAEWLPRA